MDAAALAEALAPCLAWQPPPPRKARAHVVARQGVWDPACGHCLLFLRWLEGSAGVRRTNHGGECLTGFGTALRTSLHPVLSALGSCRCSARLMPVIRHERLMGRVCQAHAPDARTRRVQGYTMVEGSPRWRRGTAVQEAAFAAAEAAVAAAESPTALADRSELDARQARARGRRPALRARPSLSCCSLVARGPPRLCACRLHRHARVALSAAAQRAIHALPAAPWCRSTGHALGVALRRQAATC